MTKETYIPKIKSCPYACLGCDNFSDRLAEQRHRRIVDNIPEGRAFGDYGGMKPRVCAGLKVVEKRYVDSD
jgi:hypothetical protein